MIVSTARTGEQAVSADLNELRLLFHRLNNQLGIILAHSELLEAKAVDDASRGRAAQVVSSVLDAMNTAKDLRRKTDLATL